MGDFSLFPAPLLVSRLPILDRPCSILEQNNQVSMQPEIACRSCNLASAPPQQRELKAFPLIAASNDANVAVHEIGACEGALAELDFNDNS